LDLVEAPGHFDPLPEPGKTPIVLFNSVEWFP
jgi:hypothetical protein